MLRDSVSPRLSILTHPKWLVIVLWRKLLTKSGPNGEKWHVEWELQPSSSCLCTVHVWETTLHEKSFLLKEDCLVDEDDDGFLLQPYSHRSCLHHSWPGLTAGTSGGQQLICLVTSNSEPRHLWGCCQRCTRVPLCICASKEAGSMVITKSLILLHASSRKTGLAFSRNKNNFIRKAFSDQIHHWLQLLISLEAKHRVQVLVLSPVEVRDEFEPVILWLVFILHMNCITDFVLATHSSKSLVSTYFL